MLHVRLPRILYRFLAPGHSNMSWQEGRICGFNVPHDIQHELEQLTARCNAACSWQFSRAWGAGHRKESFYKKSGSLSILRQAEQGRL